MRGIQIPIENLFVKTSRHPHFPFTFELEEDGIQGKLEVVDLDRLSCALHRLEIKKQEESRSNVSFDILTRANRLKDQGEQIIQKVTYLLEPLSLIEWDKYTPVVQIRSFPPQVREDFIEFYELLLHGEENQTSLTLVRYRNQKNNRLKETRPMILTREVLERLLGDLFGVIKGGKAEVTAYSS
ncbi:MAG TPA: hypothetical protein VNM22_02315 [Candidatus Limnocylindrales bacterium]|nr:hypothetical protein [Candidatus Limnocylindrales bacterium]